MVLPVLLGAPRLLITPHLPTIVWSISRGPPKDSRALGLCLNPFKTAVPLWGQTAQISSTLSPKWDCSPERVITRIEDLVPLIPVTFLFGSVRTARLLLFFFQYHFCFPALLVGGFTLNELLDEPWSQVSTLLPPRYVPFIFWRA